MEEPQKVGMLGAGVMGSEIALCFAAAGCEVALKEPELTLAEKGKKNLERVLDTAIGKGKFPADKRNSVLELITPTADYDIFGDRDLVIEAVFEDLEVKKTVLSEADKVCKPECVIATNTSSIPITLLGAAVNQNRRTHFIGAHFFAPAFVMKLVEVIPGLETAPETVDYVMDACRMIDKQPALVKDVAGFVVNRLLFSLFNEAVRLVDEGVASYEDIDLACRLGLGHPIGPFALMDLGDLGLARKVGAILEEAYGDRFRFGSALKQRAYAGHLGRKTGQGWYTYEK